MFQRTSTHSTSLAIVMLLGLIVLISVANIGLAFYTTLVFRRDRRRAREEKGARCELIGAADEPLPRGSAPAAANPAGQASRGKPAAAAAATDAAPPRSSPSKIDPILQHPLEDLFYRGARLVDDLAAIDHSVMAGRAGEPPADQTLIGMWPQLADKTAPIEDLLRKAGDLNDVPPGSESAMFKKALLDSGRKLAAQSRTLAASMQSEDPREPPSESGLHDLRDLFMMACMFRDQCESYLADTLKTDHRLYGCAGLNALKQYIAAAIAEGGDSCWAIGMEIDHIRELNSLHGAKVVNSLLDHLPQLLESQLPACQLFCRHLGQHFVALAAGERETLAAAVDRVRQQLAKTAFRFDDRSIEVTMSAAIVPVSVGPDKMLGRLATVVAEAKAKGYNQMVCDYGDHRSVVSESAAAVEPRKVVLHG